MVEIASLCWKYLCRPALLRYRRRGMVASVLLISFMYLGQSKAWFRLPFQQISIYEAFSNKTPLIIECTSYKSILTTVDSSLQQDLYKIAALQQLENQLKEMDSCFSKLQNTGFLQSKHLVAGLYLVSKDKLAWLTVVDVKAHTFKASYLAKIPQKTNYYSTNYQGLEVHHIVFQQGKKWIFAWYDNLLLMSTNAFVVESAIKQLKDIKGNVCLDAAFRTCQTSQKQQGVFTFYLNYQTIGSLTTVIADVQKPLLAGLKNLGKWSRFNLRSIDKGLLVNGQLQPLPQNRFLQAMLAQKPHQNASIASYIPSNFAFMMYWSWSNFKTLYEQASVVDYLDFEHYFLPWIGQNMALIIKDPVDDQHAFAKDFLMLVHCKDTVLARQSLIQLGQQKGLLDQRSFQNHEMIQLASLDALKPILGAKINPLQNPYFTFIDDYVVFSNARATLEAWIKNYNTQQLAIHQPGFHSFFKQMTKSSNMYALLNSPNAYKLVHYFYGPSMKTHSLALFEGLKKIYPIGIQWHALDNSFAISLSANYEPRPSENNQVAAVIAWESTLMSPAIIAPQVLTGHQSAKYILVQDSLKRLYLFDKNGDNLWPADRVLEYAINSKVYSIDFYDNNEVQYAFSTAYHIHVIDDKGLQIKLIPLISPAAGGLLVKNFGQGPLFFIACNNGNIYGYNQFGKPLSGWRPLQGNGTISRPLQYMQFNEKKYFVGLNKVGQLQAFDRKGSVIFSANKSIENITKWGLDTQIGRIALGSDEGAVYLFNSSGQNFSFKPISGMKKPVEFLYCDLLGDQRKDYVRINDSLLYIHYYQKDEQGRDEIQKEGPYPVSFSNNTSVFEVKVNALGRKMIGVLDHIDNSVALIDSKGRMQAGFPLPGSTAFSLTDLFEENGTTLVVANQRKIYACKLKFLF